jgi:hypothetical protein
MNIGNKQIVEVIGILTVVASLLFVGLQLLLDRRVAVGEQYFNRAEAQRADLRSMMESDSFYQYWQESWDRGIRPPWWEENSALADRINQDIFSVKSLYFSILVARMGVVAFDNLYFQYRQGLLEEEDWLVYQEIMKKRMIEDIVDRNEFIADTRPISKIIDALRIEIESDGT